MPGFNRDNIAGVACGSIRQVYGEDEIDHRICCRCFRKVTDKKRSIKGHSRYAVFHILGKKLFIQP